MLVDEPSGCHCDSWFWQWLSKLVRMALNFCFSLWKLKLKNFATCNLIGSRTQMQQLQIRWEVTFIDAVENMHAPLGHVRCSGHYSCLLLHVFFPMCLHLNPSPSLPDLYHNTHLSSSVCHLSSFTLMWRQINTGLALSILVYFNCFNVFGVTNETGLNETLWNSKTTVWKKDNTASEKH